MNDLAPAEKDRFEAYVSRETYERFRTYSAAILRWTKTINLIARGEATEETIWCRHILDCLQLLPLIPEGVDCAIDLGSGAGFPGMVIAIARPDIVVTMVESDRRKAAFLQATVAELGLRAVVLPSRIEAVAVAPARLVTARALAPLPGLLDYAAPVLAHGGVCLFLKGRTAEDELTAAAQDWQMNVERFASRTEPDAAILRISELCRVS